MFGWTNRSTDSDNRWGLLPYFSLQLHAFAFDLRIGFELRVSFGLIVVWLKSDLDLDLVVNVGLDLAFGWVFDLAVTSAANQA